MLIPLKINGIGKKSMECNRKFSLVNDFKEVLRYFMIEYVTYAKLKCLLQCISHVIEIHRKERQFDI
jgi:hypothetical protein